MYDRMHVAMYFSFAGEYCELYSKNHVMCILTIAIYDEIHKYMNKDMNKDLNWCDVITYVCMH